jgi:pimeloyl-ACP methyl ester carboxylesterase
MPEVKLADGGTLHYEEHGRGEPVLFLNGLMMATRSWVDHVPLLERHVRLILVDFRDQGRSSGLEAGYDLTRHVADLEAFLEALGLDRVHVMGLSYGGEVALLHALDHPRRYQSLVLANVPLRTGNYLAAVGRAWETAAALHDGEQFFRLGIPYVYSSHFYEREQAWLDSREALFAKVLTPEYFEALIRLSQVATGFEVTPAQLRTLHVPTLLLGADEDQIAPLRDLEVYYEHLPHAEMMVLYRTGHGAFYERRQEFCTALLGFVRKHGGASHPDPAAG